MSRSASQIRSEFIDYFVKRAGHTFAPSSPVVPHDDPTLLFTNAGMNQFKDVFLGTGSRPYKRAVNTQKCIRAGGKHNDLEDVGKDTYHHTFFEMLGNWSFGDYFKKEAIDWAWDLLVNVWKLDPNRLHATYFEGDAGEKLEPDTEARDLWLRYLPTERVHPGNKKDNFWEMGDSGPCGPCSEIHFDQTRDGKGGSLVNAGDPRVIEFWNLVFIQFNRAPGTGKLSPLPAKHVDTGMGFERIVRIIQNKTSNYDTDLWMPIFAAIEQISGAKPYRGKLDDHTDIAYRVIADHVRCLTFAITDGARPSNEGRGYVLRRILRRGVRHAHQTLGVKGLLLCQIVPAVVQSLGDAFPELKKNPQHVINVIREEEEAFLKTLDRGIDLLGEAAGRAAYVFYVTSGNAGREDVGRFVLSDLQRQGVVGSGSGLQSFHPAQADWTLFEGNESPQISAADAFKLHDTYGFPIDLTRVMAEERGMTVDEAGFEQLMEEARQKSRTGGVGSREAASGGGQVSTLPPEALARLKAMNVKPTDDIDKYHGRPIRARIEAIWNGGDFDEHTDDSHQGDVCAIITDKTNFYAESGGQIGDTGRISDQDGDRSEFIVQETKSVAGYVLHIGRLTRGKISVGETVQLSISGARRDAIRANHTATHLLNLALRDALGDDVNQKGSLVAEDRLRFDFSHGQALAHEELDAVEQQANAAIRNPLKVHAESVPLEAARKINGVRAVFGEKYPDPVRVVSIGVPVKELLANPSNHDWRRFSVEFCGGTHLATTDEAKQFVIVREESLAAGVRRIQGLTGAAAQAADIAGRDLEQRAQNASKLPDDLLPGEFDEIVKVSEELTISTVRRHRIVQLIEQLRSRVKAMRKSTQSASRDVVVDQARALAEKSDGRLIIERIDNADKDALLAAMDVFRSRKPEAAAMLLSANEIEGKVVIVAAVPKSIIDLGLKAGDWVKQAAGACGGSGGGKPDMAQAGGKDVSKIPQAMTAAREFAEQKLGSTARSS